MPSASSRPMCADHETQKFHTANDNVYRLFVKAETVLALNSPVMQFTMYMCILAISWLGAHMIAAQSHHGSAHEPVYLRYEHPDEPDDALHDFRDGDMARASADRIAEVLEEKADLTSRPPPAHAGGGRPRGFDHVSFSYKKKSGKPVLDDIDLHIRSGETVGIIGGTGSAKSSLVQLIPRLYDVAEGAVRVGGVDVRDTTWKPCATRWPWCCRKNVLFRGTIRENLLWGDKNATDEEMERACRLAQADEFIRALPGRL